MSSSPTRHDDSRPDSPPQSTAQVRSQAIAKLKRAASLPRTPDGRRTPQDAFAAQIPAYEAGPSSYQDGQEVLSPSPVSSHFDTTAMQRSASAATPSSSQMGFSPSNSSQYHAGSPINVATPDWSAMQLAHSYLPSLSPGGLSPSPHHHGSGRNTPSPLPSLGELRILQRSNSHAARAKAMSKLTGGSHDRTSPTRVNLQRSGTVGGHPRALDPIPPLHFAQPADDAAVETRPRLQRSFTVSSSNMGEERRSAVGRRMVERLAERRAARQQEEEEVRRLWEERQPTLEAQQGNTSALGVHDDQEAENAPDLILQGSAERFHNVDPSRADTLAPPDRPASRVTMRSITEPFEYESHLRRSLSSRTARGGADGPLVEPIPNIIMPDQASNDVEQLHLGPELQNLALQVDDEPLLPPQPNYATPTRRLPHSSTSTVTTLQGSQSPGSSTLSGLDSMMFVTGGMGGGQGGLRGSARPGESNWPSEVDAGSDWGTPARDLHQATFADSPVIPSPLPSDHARLSVGDSANSVDGDPISSSRHSTRTDSVMSWEEVGGREDQVVHVPTDRAYHNKSGSISAKIGRTMRSMRKRSQSRSSITSSSTSPPTSPQQQARSSRRQSESSTSPSQRSMSRSLSRNDHSARHQPSISSLAPSIDSSANNMLLQHQLSNDPSQVSFLPRAHLSDPRVLNSKLSPFPGIAQFEGRSMMAPGDAPKLLHQMSDSIVPSQQRVVPAGVGSDSIYALPLPAQADESRRSSADSTAKRNWLAKAFGQQTSPRSSGSASQKGSISEAESDAKTSRRTASRAGVNTPDPFAGPPPPNMKPNRHRSASPSVSVVPEDSEEGSRYTRFATNNRGESLKEEDETQQLDTGLPPKSQDVLTRMDEVLALAPDDPARPDMLDDPPRKLLISAQILQVVNVHTVKDRYLFLFNDILVIAKPIISHGVAATLDMKFVVKSIVSLDKLAISGYTDEPTTEPERHPVVTNFVQRFAEDPATACQYLVEKSRPKVDPVTLASLIFKTPELDKAQIGHLLASNDVLMRAFIDRFHYTGIRIDSALRMFLLSLRLPTERTSCESLLRGFAHQYFDANKKVVSYDRDLAAELVLAIMQFNDALYGTFGFALPNHAITRDTFIGAFQSKDSRGLVPTELLSDIYTSIRTTRLVQALSSHEDHLAKDIVVTPRRMPSKLTYNIWSEKISVKIPEPDPAFKIRLLGEGLEFDPPVLDFSNTAEVSFRVRGKALGTKSLLFDRIGDNAALYGEIGNMRHFTVERAFMRHTFQVAFVSHTGLKRKYCFSVNDAEMRQRWGAKLERQIRATKEAKSSPVINRQQEISRTADLVSLQVLRDALIPPEDKAAPVTKPIPAPPALLRGNSSTNRRELPQLGAPIDGREKNRSGSVSVVYAQEALEDESDLGPLQATRGAGGNGDSQSGMMEVQSGKELVLLCRQNSLLPGLLELLQAGKEGAGLGGIGHGGGHGGGGGGSTTVSRADSLRANGMATRV